MNDSSRLDAALQERSDTDGQWFRSPLVLVGGIILFLGALALIVLAATGGDDAVEAPASAVATAELEVEVEPVSFGGVGIPEVDAVTISGDLLPALGQPDDDPAVGMLMPEITATSLANGNPITL